MLKNFSKAVRTTLVHAPIAAGSTTPAGQSVDCQDFGGCAFTALLGTHGTTCITTLQIQGSTSSTGWQNLSGAVAASTAGVDDRYLQVDVDRPSFRYLRPVVTRSSTAGGSEYGGTIAQQYAPRHHPVTQPSTSYAAAPVLTVSATT